MSTTYSGVPGNVVNNLLAAVSSTTGNAVSPIVVTTSSPHFYSTGDRVLVNGVAGNTAANCAFSQPWTITVTGASTFSLNGSTGNGAYVGGGSCFDFSITQPMTIPSDGDAFNVSSVNVALQTVADRTQLLGGFLPPTGYSLIAQYSYAVADDTGATWANVTPAITTWVPVPNTVFATLASVTPTCNAGDVLDVSLTTTMTITGGGKSSGVKIRPKLASGTANIFNDTVYTGSRLAGLQTLYADAATSTAAVPLTARQMVFIPSVAGTAASITWAAGVSTISGLSGMSTASVGNTIKFGHAAAAGNRGSFVIASYVNSTTVTIANASGSTDGNNGSVGWAVDGSTFDFQVYAYSNYNVVPIALTGDRLYVVNHYRPTASGGAILPVTSIP